MADEKAPYPSPHRGDDYPFSNTIHRQRPIRNSIYPSIPIQISGDVIDFMTRKPNNIPKIALYLSWDSVWIYKSL